jgi:hypothetical protein
VAQSLAYDPRTLVKEGIFFFGPVLDPVGGGPKSKSFVFHVKLDFFGI